MTKQEEFDEAFLDFVADLAADEILEIPGVYKPMVKYFTAVLAAEATYRPAWNPGPKPEPPTSDPGPFGIAGGWLEYQQNLRKWEEEQRTESATSQWVDDVEAWAREYTGNQEVELSEYDKSSIHRSVSFRFDLGYDAVLFLDVKTNPIEPEDVRIHYDGKRVPKEVADKVREVTGKTMKYYAPDNVWSLEFLAHKVPGSRWQSIVQELVAYAPVVYNPVRLQPEPAQNPAGVVRTAQDERDWKKAKEYYARGARGPESSWESPDWATVMVIFKNIKAKRRR